MNPKIKNNLTILVIFIIISGLFFIGKSGFSILSGMRAYVGGEGLWAKGQKEATYQLLQYVFTGEANRYQSFVDNLKVPLGDKVARLELEKTNPVDEIIIQGFSDGGNHPADIPTMIFLYKYFKNQNYVKKAIEQWEAGDRLIEELLEIGEQTNRKFTNNSMNKEQTVQTLALIDALQIKLNEAERLFSYNMSAAARWTANLLFIGMLLFTLIGSILCFVLLRLIAGIISDLNHQKTQLENQAEQEMLFKKELQESEEKFRNISENSLVGVNIIQDGVFIYANPKFAETFGYSIEECLNNMHFHQLVYPEDLDIVKKQIRRRVSGEVKSVHYAFRGIKKSGKIVHVEIYGSSIQLNGKAAVVGAVLDITERKQMEEKLWESEEKYRRIFENSIVGFFQSTPEGRFLRVNSAFAAMLGYESPDELVSEISDITTQYYANPEDRRRYKDLLQKSGAVINFEFKAKRKNGSQIWVSNSTRAYFNKDGNVDHYEGIVIDITKRKRAEEEKQKLQAQLQQAQKLEAIGILAGGLAHDFNNLISIIVGNIDLAKEDIKPELRISENILEAEKASFRAKELTKQLITFSKGGEPIKETGSIGDLVKETTSLTISGSNAMCEFSLPENLWLAEFDEGQMKHAIKNLVDNAIEAMPDGGSIDVVAENVEIDPETKASDIPLSKGKYIKIAINDKGIGISEDHLSKIFDPYFSTKEMGVQKGMGMGLATTYSIINRHKGHIIAESELGVGTTFAIFLPAAVEEIAGKEPVKRVEPEKPAILTGKILVMDDEEMIRKLATKALNRLGYETELAQDGDEAIELYKRAMGSAKSFDAVILDLTVKGGMGGKDAIKELLEINPQVKAIVSSGYSNDPEMTAFKKYGFVEALPKPYAMKDLKDVLEKVITE